MVEVISSLASGEKSSGETRRVWLGASRNRLFGSSIVAKHSKGGVNHANMKTF
jgi:hypothetical protein